SRQRWRWKKVACSPSPDQPRPRYVAASAAKCLGHCADLSTRRTFRHDQGMGSAWPPLIKPMLATPGDLPTEPGWAHEAKYDGVRAVSYVNSSGELRILSRSMRDVTSSYPEIAILPSMFPGHSVVVDGELVTLDTRGAPSFNLLQSRIAVTAPGKALLASA